jgi:hypothetical protein
MLIFRRSNFIVTTSGIVTLRKQLFKVPVESGALNSCLRRVTISDAVTVQFDLLKMSVVLLETCRGLKCNIYYYRINKLCMKLVIETSLHYDARPEKHQTSCTVNLSEKTCREFRNVLFFLP